MIYTKNSQWSVEDKNDPKHRCHGLQCISPCNDVPIVHCRHRPHSIWHPDGAYKLPFPPDLHSSVAQQTSAIKQVAAYIKVCKQVIMLLEHAHIQQIWRGTDALEQNQHRFQKEEASKYVGEKHLKLAFLSSKKSLTCLLLRTQDHRCPSQLESRWSCRAPWVSAGRNRKTGPTNYLSCEMNTRRSVGSQRDAQVCTQNYVDTTFRNHVDLREGPAERESKANKKKSDAFLWHGVEVLIQSTDWIDRMQIASSHRNACATKIAIRVRTDGDNLTGQVQGPEFDTAIVTSRNKDSVPDAHKRSDSVPVTMQSTNILSFVRIPQTDRPWEHTTHVKIHLPKSAARKLKSQETHRPKYRTHHPTTQYSGKKMYSLPSATP